MCVFVCVWIEACGGSDPLREIVEGGCVCAVKREGRQRFGAFGVCSFTGRPHTRRFRNRFTRLTTIKCRNHKFYSFLSLKHTCFLPHLGKI